jgi:hypothetical protein
MKLKVIIIVSFLMILTLLSVLGFYQIFLKIPEDYYHYSYSLKIINTSENESTYIIPIFVDVKENNITLNEKIIMKGNIFSYSYINSENGIGLIIRAKSDIEILLNHTYKKQPSFEKEGYARLSLKNENNNNNNTIKYKIFYNSTSDYNPILEMTYSFYQMTGFLNSGHELKGGRITLFNANSSLINGWNDIYGYEDIGYKN